jgi:membrane-associated phospholipid phosphatase
MDSVEERKFPTLLFISISYIIGNWLLKSNVVDLLSLIYYGYGLALIFSYILLFFQIKISLHTTAISGLLGFLIYFSYFYKINLIILLAVLFALSGIIGSSRLKLKAHNLKEVSLGYVVGLGSQIIVFAFYII